ncbi:MAG: hydroxymethylbilane synthase [Bacteroidetes bacterium 46-16]|nr:MAG: hydroxymethylbilane synthase [Bacteroidetes bacterium 46-16]
MNKKIRIGTRDSQLAVWQATQVQGLLKEHGYESELVYVKSEGDTDLVTPLYEIGVQGIFTRTLDASLLSGQVDIAVHSMKDVPTIPAKGIVPAAVLPRASYKDILVPKTNGDFLHEHDMVAVIATSSIRRRAQWMNRYPHHIMENLRGNVNTRLRKVRENNWQGAIFAAAGLERIGLRPENAIDLDWMLPAPAQGAIMVVCREYEEDILEACSKFHDENTALCTKIERDFLRTLMGGCSTPISALAEINDGHVQIKGNLLTQDGWKKKEISLLAERANAGSLGIEAAEAILKNGGQEILEQLQSGQ